MSHFEPFIGQWVTDYTVLQSGLVTVHCDVCSSKGHAKCPIVLLPVSIKVMQWHRSPPQVVTKMTSGSKISWPSIIMLEISFSNTVIPIYERYNIRLYNPFISRFVNFLIFESMNFFLFQARPNVAPSGNAKQRNDRFFINGPTTLIKQEYYAQTVRN